MSVFFRSLSGWLLLAATMIYGTEIVFIPFQLESVDSSTETTINELFVESLQSFGIDNITMLTPSSPCREKTCALAIADSLKAQQVIFGSARRLGSKWIVRAFHYQLGNEKPLSSHTLDCRSIEDFEPVMKRLAEAIAKGKNTEAVAAIDNITQTEADESRFRRREGFYSLGLQFGYLYPYGEKSYTRWKYSSYGDYNAKELQYKQVLSTDFVNWFELPYNLSLQWDLHIGWAAEIGSHIIMLKQFGRGDYSPYIGIGTGLDYCFMGDAAPDSIEENHRNSGFALIGKCGIQLLRTYNFRIHMDGGYKIVFNDDRDQGPFANIGIMWRKNRKSAASASYSQSSYNNPIILGLAGLGGLVLLLTTIATISTN